MCHLPSIPLGARFTKRWSAQPVSFSLLRRPIPTASPDPHRLIGSQVLPNSMSRTPMLLLLGDFFGCRTPVMILESEMSA